MDGDNVLTGNSRGPPDSSMSSKRKDGERQREERKKRKMRNEYQKDELPEEGREVNTQYTPFPLLAISPCGFVGGGDTATGGFPTIVIGTACAASVAAVV